MFVFMLCSHKFIPQAFLKKFPCHYLEYGNNQSPYVSFSIDNVLENSYMVDNVHGNIVVTANHVNQKADAHIIAGTNSEIKNQLKLIKKDLSNDGSFFVI